MKKKSSNVKYILGVIVIVLIAIFGSKYGIDLVEDVETSNVEENTQKLVNVEESNENLKVHFIDVGQADCILLEQSGHFMLIDAGNNDDGNIVVDYLKKQEFQEKEYSSQETLLWMHASETLKYPRIGKKMNTMKVLQSLILIIWKTSLP